MKKYKLSEIDLEYEDLKKMIEDFGSQFKSHWTLKIEKVNNGYTALTNEGVTEVFAEKSIPEYEEPKDHFLDLLNFICDYFAEHAGRYDKLRPYVCYKVGDKAVLKKGELEKLRKQTNYEILS